VGLNGPYVSDVVKTAVPLRNWVAVTSGYEIEHLYSRYCDTAVAGWPTTTTCSTRYSAESATSRAETPVVPGGPADRTRRPFVNFMKVGDALMRHGESKVLLGIAQTGRVQVHVYDVAGARCALLADRVFPAGEQTLVWDGTDDGGRKVRAGFISCAAAR
jgi:hypothetical protein